MIVKQDNPLRAQDVRQHNEKMVLYLIYKAKRPGISQSEVVQATGLKAPTVFRIFTNLETEKLIESIEANNSSTGENLQKKGRKPVCFRVNENALYSIGVDFWVDCIALGVFNFNGTLIYSTIIELKQDLFAHEVVTDIIINIQKVISELSLDINKILGIGIAAPGQVNVALREIVYYSRFKNMTNFPVADIIQKALNIPVYIHNNCSAIAQAEYRYGLYNHGEALFTFLIRSGVNGAFVNKDNIYITSQSTTLESGHIPIDLDGPLCTCGQNGCLEAYILKLNEKIKGHNDHLLEALEKSLQTEDSEAQALIDEAARYLFASVKTVIRFFRPKSFLFITSSQTVSEALAKAVEKLRTDQPGNFDFGVINFFSHPYSVQTALRGASDLVINSYFS